MTIIRVGTLIDGTGAPPVRDAVVTFENGRIEAVTTGASGGRSVAGEGACGHGQEVATGGHASLRGAASRRQDMVWGQ